MHNPKKENPQPILNIQVRYLDENTISIQGEKGTLDFSVREWRMWMLHVTQNVLINDNLAQVDKLGYLISDVAAFCDIMEFGALSHERKNE